jgi:hypothetical protein
MADPNQIEQELQEYLDKEPNLRRSDKIAYLMSIVNKHFAIDKIDHVINHRDFHDIVSSAKSSFSVTKMPVNISNKEVDGPDIPHVLVIEAFVGYLNKHKLIKRLVKFNFTR